MRKDVDKLLADLAPMLKKARGQGLYFVATFDDTEWMTADELVSEIHEGKFLYGPENWRLRPPELRLAQLFQNVSCALHAYNAFVKKVLDEKANQTN